MTKLFRFAAALCCCIALTLPLAAQQAPTSASVSGTVHDPSGEPVAGASATVTHLERNQTQTAVTNEAGALPFPGARRGDYRLDLTVTGFALWQRRLRLTVGATLEVPVTLSAAFEDAVTVTTEAPILETARTQVSSTISPEEVQTLPLNGRNYLDLALLAPGVSRTNTGANQRFAETSAVPSTGISISSSATSPTPSSSTASPPTTTRRSWRGRSSARRSSASSPSSAPAASPNSAAPRRASSTSSPTRGRNNLRGDAYGFFRNDRLRCRQRPVAHASFRSTSSSTAPRSADR